MTHKARLLELIKNSVTFNSLPKAIRNMQADIMLKADPKTMEKFVKVLEIEEKEVVALAKFMEKDLEKAEEIAAEVTQIEKNLKKDAVSMKEEAHRKTEEKRVDELLKKLDEIS